MKEILLELVLNNFNKKAIEEVVDSLELICELLKKNSECGVSEILDALYQSTKALGLAKGYTEYVKQDLSSKLGVSKTAIKYIINELVKEGKVEVTTIGEIAFLKPVS